MEQQILDDDYDVYEPYSLEELEDTNELCPKCDSTLKLMYVLTSPDDYTTGVICPECRWEDTD